MGDVTPFPERLGITEADPSATGRPGDDAGRRLTVTDDLLNVNGGLHGGVIATMLDATMGAAVRGVLDEGQSTVTVSMTVTYLNAAKTGDELVAGAEVRKRGSNLVLVEGDVTRLSDDEPVAHGVATFSVLDRR